MLLVDIGWMGGAVLETIGVVEKGVALVVQCVGFAGIFGLFLGRRGLYTLTVCSSDEAAFYFWCWYILWCCIVHFTIPICFAWFGYILLVLIYSIQLFYIGSRIVDDFFAVCGLAPRIV